MEKIEKFSLPESYRGIFITDIHGNYKLLTELLKKVNYCSTDYLFIGGDLVEKGPESLPVVQKIKEMAENSNRVAVIEGNCEAFMLFLLKHPQKIIPYLSWRKESILAEMLAALGRDVSDFTDGNTLAELLWREFTAELTYLEQLPTAILTDDFILVHAALENRQDWQTTDWNFALTTPAFLDLQHQAGKPVIVGHYPVSNYCGTYGPFSNQPIIDCQKQIFALDGGNGVKEEGQLNALVIEKIQGQLSYETFSVNDFPKVTAQEKADPQPLDHRGNFIYPDFAVDLLETGPAFSLVKKQKSGEKVWVKNEFLVSKEQNYQVTQDCTSHFLKVAANDELAILQQTGDGYVYVMHEGTLGWVAESVVTGSQQTNEF